MDKKNFDQLIVGVQQMKAHMAGQHVEGIRITEISATKKIWITGLFFAPSVVFILLATLTPTRPFERIDQDILLLPIGWFLSAFLLLLYAMMMFHFSFRRTGYVFIALAFLSVQTLTVSFFYDAVNRYGIDPQQSAVALASVTTKTELPCKNSAITCSYRIELAPTLENQIFRFSVKKLDGQNIQLGDRIEIEILNGNYTGYYLKNWKKTP
jgi:hypothetical protein